jgi:sialic acid synthase SpsE
VSVFIIAEAGVNHNGDINVAKKLIDAAVYAGADAVKFQTWQTELIVTKNSQQAEYQKKNTGVEESQFEMLKKLELSYDDFVELKVYCDSKNIQFLSTADEEESADFLNTIQDVFKIGSGEITNKPYLRHIARYGKRIILSTGMSTLGEIEAAIAVLTEAGTTRHQITVLHANTEYPTPMQDVNLKAMQTIGHAFGLSYGYSDHTLGIEVPIAAVAMGASVIEKHFTLDKNMDGLLLLEYYSFYLCQGEA